MVIHNIDNDESRRVVELCYRTAKTLINPLLDWDDDFLWWYIRKNNIELNPLYSQGFCRCGCIGCPMSGKNRWTEFEMFPTYKRAYIRAFGKMLDARTQSGLENKMGWKDAESVFLWWMEDKNIEGQLKMEFDNNNNVTGFLEK